MELELDLIYRDDILFGPMQADKIKEQLVQRGIAPDKLDIVYDAYLKMEKAAKKHDWAVSLLIVIRDERHAEYANQAFREFEKKRVAFMKLFEVE
jgi:hypothetical protein